MRLGIYVYAPTTITFGHDVTLFMYKPGESSLTSKRVAAGDTPLTKGIYGIADSRDTLISIKSECEIIIFEDKDPRPDAQVASNQFATHFPGVSMKAIGKLLPAVKSIDLSAVTDKPEANGHGGAERNGAGTTGR